MILLNKNYYDILEVNKNASPEIIEKAYKTLVKKYHPDLQENNLKNKFEEKIKEINEAYEILSNSEKRKNYDLNLKATEITQDDYNILYNENINLKNEINTLKNIINNSNNIINKINNVQQYNNYYKNFNNINKNNYNREINNSINKNNYNKKMNNNNNNNNNNINKDYSDTNIQNSKNKKYKINYKKTLQDFLALLITIIIFIFIGFIIWHIPFTKNYLINLYNDNSILQFFVNLILNLFN